MTSCQVNGAVATAVAQMNNKGKTRKQIKRHGEAFTPGLLTERRLRTKLRNSSIDSTRKKHGSIQTSGEDKLEAVLDVTELRIMCANQTIECVIRNAHPECLSKPELLALRARMRTWQIDT